MVAPPEQKLEPTPAKPEPAKIAPVEKPVPEKPKVVRPDARKPSDATPAPRTSAPPRAEREAPLASAVNAGSVASVMATYYQRVRAHLMRFHQYPAGANGQSGVARLSFTLGRGGQVMSSRLGGSSGVAVSMPRPCRCCARPSHFRRSHPRSPMRRCPSTSVWRLGISELLSRAKRERSRATPHFAFRKSATSSSMNSLSSALLGSRLDENGRLLSLPTMMWVVVDAIDVLDGEEREGEHAVIERLARLLVGVLDLHQVDIADLAHGLADIGLGQLDLVDALELGEVREAVLAAGALPGRPCRRCLRRCRAR